MSSIVRRTLALTAVAVLLGAAVALAAGPKKGATYNGVTVHGMAAISLNVAKNGKSVTVKLAYPPAYCQSGGGPTRQITKPAKISGSGKFSGSIAYEFTITHKVTAKLYFTGKFVANAVTGTARSEFGVNASPQVKKSLAECNGSTAYTAVTK